MVSTTHLEPVANSYLFLTNILSNVKIDKLVVPAVVASDCGEALLECEFSGAGDDVTVLWLHNGSEVYEWRRGAKSKISGLLDGRADSTHRFTNGGEKCTLRIVDLAPDLSGEYTCVVRSRGREAREVSSMTVFSPEQDFVLTFGSPLDSDIVDIKCTAKHLHPQPELTIEYNKVPIAQQQRTWREGAHFEAASRAVLPRAGLRPRAELACRLHLPLVDYTAITKKYLHFDNRFSGGRTLSSPSYLIVGFLILTILDYNV